MNGHNFDYHARGMQILIGRLIVLALIIVLNVSQFIHIGLYLVALLGFLAVLPFLVTRSLRFNARMSSYRNVRLDFVGRVSQAIWPVIVLPILVVLSLYTTTPFLERAFKRFVANNHRYGGKAFHFDVKIGKLYKPFLIVAGLTIVAFIIIGFLLTSIAQVFARALVENNPFSIGFIITIAAIYVVAFLIFIPLAVVYGAMVRNIYFSNTVFDGQHQFASTLRPFKLLGIALTNMVAILLTFGLMIPWARVRWARYLASCTAVVANGDLEEFHHELQSSEGVVSAEYLDGGGFDVGIGV